MDLSILLMETVKDLSTDLRDPACMDRTEAKASRMEPTWVDMAITVTTTKV